MPVPVMPTAIDREDLGADGSERDVLSDRVRHQQSADNRICDEIGLIAECAVEDGGIVASLADPKGSS